MECKLHIGPETTIGFKVGDEKKKGILQDFPDGVIVAATITKTTGTPTVFAQSFGNHQPAS